MGSAPGFEDLPECRQERARSIVAAAAADAAERALRFEFRSFRIGTRPLPEMADGASPGDHDLVRAVIRVELRRRLEEAWPGCRFEGLDPEMIVEVRPREDGAGAWLEPQVAFVAGRYRKLSRELSQTRLDCRRCRGRGRRRGAPCDACEGTGRGVAEAVEDFVLPPVEEALEGRGATFHGAGREDVDVRMLGAGRPFVVSVTEPVRRSLDGDAVAARVRQRSGGRVEVADLRIVPRSEKRRITVEHGAKTYRAVVEPVGDRALPDDAAERLVALGGATLAQRNPRRVPRRADVVRERRVRALEVEGASPERLVLRVATDPGLYVKEMVSGDEGRTSPSVAALLGVPCVCAELDVLAVGSVPAPEDGQDNR